MGILKTIWFFIRHFSLVSSSFKYGKGLKMGYLNIIQEGVVVGDNINIQNFVLLKSNTIIGNDCYIDSYVLTSGSCQIGNNVILRYQSIVARNVFIEDDVFFTAGVKTIYLNHKREQTAERLVIKKGCFFGDSAVIMGGITVAEGCIIGANAFLKYSTEPNGVYVGVPARRLRDITEDEKR